MPPTRRQPPPPKGESKAALVIALVFFILTTIIGGVLAYMFKGEATELVKAAKDSEEKARLAVQQRNEMEAKSTLRGIMIGDATPKEREGLVAVKDAKVLNEVIGNLNKMLEGTGVQWDSRQDAPVISLIARLKEIDTLLKDTQAKLATALADNGKNLVAYNTGVDEEKAGRTAALNGQKAANDALLALQKVQAQALKDALQLITEVREKLASADTSKAASETELKKKINELLKVLEEKDARIRKQQEKLDLNRDELYGTDKPKGRIERVDNRAGIAWINIGSADFARPQLTFSILAPSAVGKGAGKKDRKGALEVVKILGEHLSQARITDVTNPLQDPILEGDLIFNPAWDPNSPEHIAIAGHIDLNGDGLDDTPEVVRMLEKQGVVVDAWLDMRAIEIKGSGLNPNTSFLILGDMPQSDSTAGQQVVGEREKKKNEIRTRVQELKDQAIKMGVPIIQHRQYFKSAGFPAPKNPIAPEFVPSSLAKPSADAPPPAKKADDKGKDKDKDEGK